MCKKNDISGLFLSSDEQLKLVADRNRERNWGFLDSDFESLGTPPLWPGAELSATVLEVTFLSVEKTFKEALRLACKVVYGEELETNWDLRLIELPCCINSNPQYERGLRWRNINLAANRHKCMGALDVVQSIKSPAQSVLWAASYFPNWINSMDGKKVPYIWIPGYVQEVVKEGWGESPNASPAFNRVLNGKLEIQLGQRRWQMDHVDREFAIPEFVE